MPGKIESETIYKKEISDITSFLGSDIENGLSGTSIEKNFSLYGLNSIATIKKTSRLLLFFKQLKSPVVYLLFVTICISFFLNESMNALAVVIVLIVNTLIGFTIALQAERSMDALRKMVHTFARVIRNGKTLQIDAVYLVPGDLILLESGDLVPADARIISSNSLQVNQSALTGESLPVDKFAKVFSENVPLAEQSNMIFNGTFVTRGNCTAIIVSIGSKTQIGKISELVITANPVSTPLEIRIEKFSRKLILLTLILVALVFLIGLINDFPIFTLLETAISLGVAAIPEGLPVVVTISLAYGMLKMARKNVLVRKLAAIETLGNTNLIGVDKTGTLTENKLKVDAVVSGISEWKSGSKIPDSDESFGCLMMIAVLCSNVKFTENTIHATDPLELALVEFVFQSENKIWTDIRTWKRTSEEPFTSQSRMMITYYEHDDCDWVFFKGSLEAVLPICKWSFNLKGQLVELVEEFKNEWLTRELKLATNGLRVIAGAFRQSGKVNNEIILAGLFGLIDPPVQECVSAIRECKQAGIDVIMLTGDHPATAKNIAHRLKIISEKDEVISGTELMAANLKNATFTQRVLNCKVFARVDPVQKLKLIEIFQQSGKVVAMTGDGVNDAPALTKADIGIAMGKRGTQVAQEAASLILKDDSFTSIVFAVRQGRVIFTNIRKFVVYLISCNLSEIFVVAALTLLQPQAILFPLQILFMNIVTDVFPALALGFSPASKKIMESDFHINPSQLIDRLTWIRIIFYALIITFCILIEYYTILQSGFEYNKDSFAHLNSVLFLTLIIVQLLHVFNMHESGFTFFNSEIVLNKYVWIAQLICVFAIVIVFQVPFFRTTLNLTNLEFNEWCLIGFTSFLMLFLAQFYAILELKIAQKLRSI